MTKSGRLATNGALTTGRCFVAVIFDKSLADWGEKENKESIYSHISPRTTGGLDRGGGVGKGRTGFAFLAIPVEFLTCSTLRS